MITAVALSEIKQIARAEIESHSNKLDQMARAVCHVLDETEDNAPLARRYLTGQITQTVLIQTLIDAKKGVNNGC